MDCVKLTNLDSFPRSVYLYLRTQKAMKQLTYKLHIPNNETFESIMLERENGGKFEFYEYLMPRPLFIPGRIPSKIYFIKKGDTTPYHTKYNILVSLLGWWGMPFGPLYTVKIFRNNLKGNDVTDDIYANLTPEGLKERQVTIEKIATIFVPLDKASHKELIKCLKKYAKTKILSSDPIVGVHIDSGTPEIYIGLDSSDIGKSAKLLKEVYKYFYRHTKFKCIDLNDGSELSLKLQEQGVVINCN